MINIKALSAVFPTIFLVRLCPHFAELCALGYLNVAGVFGHSQKIAFVLSSLPRKEACLKKFKELKHCFKNERILPVKNYIYMFCHLKCFVSST